MPWIGIPLGARRTLDRNALRGARAQQRPAAGNCYRAHHWRQLRAPALARGWRAGVSRWRRGLFVFMGAAGRALPRSRLGARHVSDFTQRADRSRDSDAGFRPRANLRSANAHISARRHPQIARGDLPVEAAKGSGRRELTVERAEFAETRKNFGRSTIQKRFTTLRTRVSSAAMAVIYLGWTAQAAADYAFNQIVPDVRQPVAVSGGSACPVRAHQLSAAASLAVRWSTAFGTNPVSILTLDQTASGRLTEIEQVISQSLAVWTGVSATTLLPLSLAPLARASTQNACASAGLHSPSFYQTLMPLFPQTPPL